MPVTLTVSTGSRLKLAPTDCALLIDTTHVVAEPVQAPLHPPNTEPTFGAAVSVTDVFVANCPLQLVGHEMPLGWDVMLPVPEPLTVVVSAYEVGDPDPDALNSATVEVNF